MPNRPGNDDRNTAQDGNDRGGQRDAASSSAGQNGSQGGAQARTRSNRGFASMDRDKQKEIASKGGKAAHAKGTAHEFDSGEAREAGRKGGVAVSRNREHMAAIGRRGGEARGQSRGRNGAPTSSGSNGNSSDGNTQTSRGAASSTDRQVAINNQNDGLNASTQGNAQPSQGNRGGNSSLGGERRPNNGVANTTDSSTRGESFGNH
jgi:general stress protein YciG